MVDKPAVQSYILLDYFIRTLRFISHGMADPGVAALPPGEPILGGPPREKDMDLSIRPVNGRTAPHEERGVRMK
jgi:hypothetical protein